MRVVRALDEAQTRRLHELYRGEWWTSTRELADVRAMLASTDVVVGLCDDDDGASGALVAFARALTDGVYKALVFDVIVDPARRGEGLGARVMAELLAVPEVARAAHKELYCLPDMGPFYERLGFSSDVGGVRLLRAKDER